MSGAILVSPIKVKPTIVNYQVTWVSDASGNVGGSTFNAKTGTILGVEFVPGTSITQPTDLYDVDCLDALGISVFDNGAATSIGSNLSNTLASHHVPLVGLAGTTIYRRWIRGGPLQVTVQNAGNTTSGVINIYVVDGII